MGTPRVRLGGGRQPTATARAIVGAPRRSLLDEPRSDLDTSRRARLRVELRPLQQRQRQSR